MWWALRIFFRLSLVYHICFIRISPGHALAHGGVGGGVNVTPVAFIIIKGDSIRMMPVAAPANTTADRIVEMVPDTLDKIASFIDSRTKKGE